MYVDRIYIHALYIHIDIPVSHITRRFSSQHKVLEFAAPLSEKTLILRAVRQPSLYTPLQHKHTRRDSLLKKKKLACKSGGRYHVDETVNRVLKRALSLSV